MAFGEHNISSLQALLEAYRSAGGMQSDRLNRRQQAIGGLNQNIWGANQTIFDLLKQKKELGEAEKERGFVAGEAERGRTFQAGQGEIGRTFEAGESEKERGATLERLLKQLASQEKTAGMQAGRELGDRQSQLLDMTMGLLKASYPVELWDNLDWRTQNKDNLRTAFRDIIRTFSVTPNEEASLVQAFDSLLFGKTMTPLEGEKSSVGGGDFGPVTPYQVPEEAEQILRAKGREKTETGTKIHLDVERKLSDIMNLVKKLKGSIKDPYEARVLQEAERFANKPNKTNEDLSTLDRLYNQIMDLAKQYKTK